MGRRRSLVVMSENAHPEPPPSPAEGWLPDRLLGATALDPGDLALAAMLHAATASGTSEELASEPAVLAAYQAILAPAAAAPVAAAARSVTVTPSLAHTTRARTRGV